jgi:hypothetical protein
MNLHDKKYKNKLLCVYPPQKRADKRIKIKVKVNIKAHDYVHPLCAMVTSDFY